jgi:hypothetical protein
MNRASVCNGSPLRSGFMPGIADHPRRTPAHDFVQDCLHRVTDAHHGVGFGTSALAGAAGHVSVDVGLQHRNNSSSSMGTTYRGASELSFTPRCTIVHRNLSDEVIAEWLAAALCQKTRKVIARAANACLRTVNEWCLARRLPSAAALIRLIAHDDDVYLAVMEMAGREPAPNLSDRHRGALLEIVEALGVK